MKKAEQKRRIIEAYEKAYGSTPKSREVKIDYMTQTGSLAHFSVRGIPFSYASGRVTKDA